MQCILKVFISDVIMLIEYPKLIRFMRHLVGTDAFYNWKMINFQSSN